MRDVVWFYVIATPLVLIGGAALAAISVLADWPVPLP